MSVKIEFESYLESLEGLVTLYYSCQMKQQEIPANASEATFVGTHNSKNSNNKSVNCIIINDSKFLEFPTILGQIYTNVVRLRIEDSDLREISMENLRHFRSLEDIRIINNQLEFLPGDLFKFNNRLQIISFNGNKIKFIGAELLDGLENFILIDLQGNLSIDNAYSKKYLANFKKDVKGKCKPPQELLPPQPVKPRESFYNDIHKFILLDEFKDFTIKVESKEFKVHKFLFITQSQTFADLIRKSPGATELVLTDISVETFEGILSFVYTDELPKNVLNIKATFAAASQLKIVKLKVILAEKLQHEIKGKDLDLLMEIFNLGLKFECQKLKLKAFEEIKKCFPGKKLKEELLEEPEKLKKIIEAKKLVDELVE